MKRLLPMSAIIAAFALAVPVLAQRGMSPSITNGTALGYPASSVLTPNNVWLGDSVPRGTARFGTFAGRPVTPRSFIPQHNHHFNHNHCWNCSYPFYPAYYYDPYFYGYGGTYFDDSSNLPGAGTFNTEQPPANAAYPAYPTYRPYYESNSVNDDQGRAYDRRDERGPAAPAAPPAATQPQPPLSANGGEDNSVRTLLIFKDGRQMEVANYAIMGSTVYLFAGDRRKIPLSDLDLDATVKANEERGTDFHVPASQNPS
jgi:hypothetical protein